MKRQSNQTASIHARLIRLTCEILSLLFSGLYIGIYQSDLIMSMKDFSLSSPMTYTALITCGSILFIGIMLARLLQKCFKPRLSIIVWTYFPVYLVEALLTDVHVSDNQVVMNPIWSWLAPVLFVAILIILLCGKLLPETNKKATVGAWFANILFLAIFMMTVCSIGNTNTIFHKEMSEKTRTKIIIQ